MGGVHEHEDDPDSDETAKRHERGLADSTTDGTRLRQLHRRFRITIQHQRICRRRRGRQLRDVDVQGPKHLGGQENAGHGTRVQSAIDRIKSVFGRNFPVLPRFTLGDYANEVQASLAARDSLTVGDDLAVSGWLPKLARVRESTDRLNAAR